MTPLSQGGGYDTAAPDHTTLVVPRPPLSFRSAHTFLVQSTSGGIVLPPVKAASSRRTPKKRDALFRRTTGLVGNGQP